MPDSLSSKITSATMEMCSFWADSFAATPMFLIKTDKRSPDRVEMPLKTWPGIVDVGTPMTYRVLP